LAIQNNGVVTVIASFLVGIVIGAGGSYIAIFPNMVQSQIEPLDQRLIALETMLYNYDDVCSRLGNVESSVIEIPDMDNRIILIENRMSDINVLSSAINNLENSVDNVEDSIYEMQFLLSELQDLAYQGGNGVQMEEISNRIEYIEASLNNLESKLNDYFLRTDRNDAYRILRKNLAQPGSYISGQIVDKIFDELQSSNNQIIQWISVVGSSHVKNVISVIINSQIPTLVWNSYSISQIQENQYNTFMVTYFPLVFDTGLPIIGEITIAKVGLIMKGTVNVSTESVTNLEIYSLTI
jgi:prefoldin subunit 5